MDANSILLREGEDGLRRHFDSRIGRFNPAAQQVTVENGKGDRSPRRFTVTDADEIDVGDDPLWMIHNLIPAKGFGIVVGLPKSGKSFVLSDALFHVAMGRPWAGQDVLQGAIIYITCEGAQGFERRVVAMRRHYGVDGKGVPFGVIKAAPDLGHKSGDVAEMAEDIREYLAAKGNPPLRGIAIDTLARTMKGADENTAKDMMTFADNCAELSEIFGCLVMGVHHAGKDTTKGARGSNALDGAVDVMWNVDKNEGFSTVSILHMKDGEDGLIWQFRLSPYVLKEASFGKGATKTCVVEILTEPGQAQPAQPKRNQKLPDAPKLLLEILSEAIGEAGEQVKGDVNVPTGARVIGREALKRYLPLKGYWDDDQSQSVRRAMLSKNLTTLKARGHIGLSKDYVWLSHR